MNQDAHIRSRRLRGIVVIAAVAALLGAAVGYGFGYFVDHVRHGKLPHLAGIDLAALTLALWLLASGAFIAAASASRRLTGRLAEPGERRTATPAQVRLYRLQGGVLALAGILLALPVLAELVPGGLGRGARIGLMLAMAALFVLQSAWNLALWRRADEFLRELIVESAMISFWVLQALLLFWAGGAKLGLLSPLTLWHALVATVGVYLAVGTVNAIRKGVY